jgi:opacity protein-like surface antigen
MIAFAVLAVALAAPAVAGDNAKPQPSSAVPKKPHLICKRDDSSTGSHMSPLVCKTAVEWQAQADDGRGKMGTMLHGQAGGSGQSTLPTD